MEPDEIGDFIGFIGALLKIFLGLGDTQFKQVIDKIFADLLFKLSAQVLGADVQMVGNQIQAQIRMKIGGNEFSCLFHKLLGAFQ